MPILIRRASSQDAQSIAKIIKICFGEEVNSAQIASLISEGKHLTFVAEDEEVIGFIDGFYTLDQDDLRRLELDLLAVLPEHSGKGIGTRLIQTFTAANEGAALIRALVAVTNIPMHNAMQNTGYQLQEQVMSLFIASEGLANANSAYSRDLIVVKTFSYTGIWLEGMITRDSIKAAHARREALGLELVGVVLPNTDSASIELLKQSNFEFIKTYQWWIISLK